MAATANPSLASLLGRTSLEDHSQLLRASEIALKASKADTEAQHVKVVALLNLNQFDDAVAFVEKAGNEFKEKVALEYAYALYKAGRLQDAASVASKLSKSRGAQHVEAQARYRLEDYSETSRIYQELQKQQVPDEDFDIRVNQSAIDAQGQWLGLTTTFRKPGREDLEAFETAYNAACGSIARGELAQAEMLLKRAKELCKYSEDLSEAQKEAELLPIIVQQLYVLHRQGKITEAEAIAQEINIGNIEDLPTKQVASNNLLLGSSKESNPFLAHKVFHGAPNIPEGDKLFSYQSIPMTSNEKTIDLQTFKFNGIVDSTRKRLASFPSPTTQSEALVLSAFNAAAHACSEVGKAAIKNVLPELERRPNDIGLTMTLVQMYALTKNTTSAIELVEALLQRLESSTAENGQDVRYHPGLISIVLSLYKTQGRKAQIKQELAKAASYWRHQSNPPISLLRAAGVSLLESTAREDLQLASAIFQKLYDEQPNNTATIAGYVASNAVANPDSIKSLTEKLTPVTKLLVNIDTDSLENAGIPQSTNALAIASSAGRSSRKRAADASASNQKKRVRKSRLPKDFDPSSTAQPDPERWLPMRDRSYYRAPKSKKKGRKGDDRTQGGNVNEDLDVSKQSQQTSKGGEVVSGSGGGGGKKKKGKGKK